jgi:hypothetical protein
MSRRVFIKEISLQEKIYRNFFIFAALKLSRGVIGNTSDSGSEEFRFET